MNQQSFALQPFTSTSPLTNCEIVGSITRYNQTLTISYELHCQLTELVIPTLTREPMRKDGLWQETCFEFFVRVKDAPQYWEFNLSPAADWNVYRFAAYRQGMEEEKAFTSLPFSIEQQSNMLRLTLEVDLAELVSANQILEVAISAVVKSKEGEVSYWALVHPGSKPDFHHRDSFILIARHD
ncbi:MAG: DOMON-like domain-containing protein [Symploca sp. SIO3E6]|nr:DOMON-like domain-containing protein [Caldora sp. SIO3E6]